MFGKLKKRLEDVVKKFSKETKEEKKEEEKEILREEKIIKEASAEPEKTIELAKESVDDDNSIIEKELFKEQEKEVADLEKHVIDEKPEVIMDEIEEELKEDITIREDVLEKDFLEKEEKIEKDYSETAFEKEIEEEIEKDLKEDITITKEDIREEPIPEEFELPVKKEEAVSEEYAMPKETKKSFFGKLVEKVVEKKLEEGEIVSITDELKKALLENDVAFEVAERICLDVKQDLSGKAVKRGSSEKVIKESLKNAMMDVMQHEQVKLEEQSKKPFTILFLGFNGVGKTTCIAKVAHRLKKHKKVLLAAGDTFRAASIEQLEEHGNRLGLNVVKHKYGSDSAAVIFDAVKHAAASNVDFVLADTAGRSHSNANLMDELKKVVRVNKPDMKILVLDSLTGNDIYDQARLFNEAVGVDAMILTKADVYEKGGAALSASYTIKKPIIFIGVGQEYEDLKYFVPEDVVKNLLG